MYSFITVLDMHNLKCPRGLVDSHRSFGQVFKTCRSPSDLAKCGFKMEFYSSEEKASALDTKSELYETEAAKARILQSSALQIVRFRALTHQHYMHLPPFIFIGLLQDGQEQLSALGTCKTAGQTIQKFEELRHMFTEANMVWNNIPFVTNEVCREIFCLLAEYSWEFVPAAVTTMVQAMFSSWGTNLMNEFGIQAHTWHGKRL